MGKSLLEKFVQEQVDLFFKNLKLFPKRRKRKFKKPEKKIDADLSNSTNRVFLQLQQDFPPEYLDWVKKAKWEGPLDVEVEKVNSSNRKDWVASNEPKKVKKFVEKISRGQLKPIILVKTPNKDKMIIVDGHHRFLAYKKLGIPITAFVGTVDEEKGPWDTLHDSQKE